MELPNIVRVDFSRKSAPTLKEMLKDELVSDFCRSVQKNGMRNRAVAMLEKIIEKPGIVLDFIRSKKGTCE